MTKYTMASLLKAKKEILKQVEEGKLGVKTAAHLLGMTRQGLWKLRKKKSLSEDKLSKLTNIAHNTIIKIELGLIKNPKIETLQNIADALGVSLDELTN